MRQKSAKSSWPHTIVAKFRDRPAPVLNKAPQGAEIIPLNRPEQGAANDAAPAYTQKTGRWILAGDIVALIIAFVGGGIAAWAANILMDDGFQNFISHATLDEFGIFAGLSAMALLWLDSNGHYRQRLPYWEIAGHILAVAGIGLLCGGFVQFALKNSYSRLWLGLSWGFFAVFIFIGRALVRNWLTKLGRWEIPALIIGTGATAQTTSSVLQREREMGYRIVKCIPAAWLSDVHQASDWNKLLTSTGARHVFLALEGSELETYQASLRDLARAHIPYTLAPPWLGLPTSSLSPHHFPMMDLMLLNNTNRLKLPLPRLIKRVFDLVVASAVLLIAALPMIAIAIAVKKDGGPILFKQPRVGLKGKLFDCYKFRSMRVDAEAALQNYLTQNPEAACEWHQFQKLRQDPRVTSVGDYIRARSLDELPQLLNVLRGEMSLVGPRPIMRGQEDFYGADFDFYQSVRPGITGPWQVSGRNKLSISERVALESWYARNWTLWLDIVILLKTVPVVLKRDSAF